MPDIELRFNLDMLVISAPIDAALEGQGFDPARDLPYLNLMEPDSLVDALRMEKAAGANCLVTPTANVTTARLAHVRMEKDAPAIARAAYDVVADLKPQHLLVEIGPCGLPLDATSKSSLNENRAQYAAAARLFADLQIDAFFLNGFTSTADLKCALMGVGQVSGRPVIASVNVGEGALLPGGRESWAEVLAMMADFGVAVAGFATELGPDEAVQLAKQAHDQVEVPLLAQLSVRERAPRQGGPTPENPYYCADAMVQAAAKLYAAGVQFLRAAGKATPAYTGALAATVSGLDVRL
ncbi:MAG: homocysteine S-methyltransferase family protein [Eggerthellaceae bacterium]|nr:homocysteine S-methyltransferase family protein [Eggerthellaceae bacterium]